MLMDKPNTKTIINHIVDFLGEEHVRLVEHQILIIETTTITDRYKLNKCARHIRYNKATYMYTRDIPNGEIRHMLQTYMPDYIDSIYFEREPITSYETIKHRIMV